MSEEQTEYNFSKPIKIYKAELNSQELYMKIESFNSESIIKAILAVKGANLITLNIIDEDIRCKAISELSWLNSEWENDLKILEDLLKDFLCDRK